MSGYRDEEQQAENDKSHIRWHSPAKHIKKETSNRVKNARDNPVNKVEVNPPSYLPRT